MFSTVTSGNCTSNGFGGFDTNDGGVSLKPGSKYEDEIKNCGDLGSRGLAKIKLFQ